MKKTKIIIIIALIAVSASTYAQNTLTIEITGIRNNTGNILYELFDKNHKSIKVGNEIIAKNKSSIVFEDLKAGIYGFNFIHDENKNKKLDTKMLLIPIEGYGYSNNPVAKFGPPDFKKWIFEINGNTSLNCTVTYLNY